MKKLKSTNDKTRAKKKVVNANWSHFEHNLPSGIEGDVVMKGCYTLHFHNARTFKKWAKKNGLVVVNTVIHDACPTDAPEKGINALRSLMPYRLRINDPVTVYSPGVVFDIPLVDYRGIRLLLDRV